MLQNQPANSVALTRWRSGYIISYALTEAIALFGLVLQVLGFSLVQAAPFYIVDVILMAFFGPRLPLSNALG